VHVAVSYNALFRVKQRKPGALTFLQFFVSAMIVAGYTHPFFGSASIATNFLLAQSAAFLCFTVLWQVSSDEGSTKFSLLALLYVNPLVRMLEFYIGVLACYLFLKFQHKYEIENIQK